MPAHKTGRSLPATVCACLASGVTITALGAAALGSEAPHLDRIACGRPPAAARVTGDEPTLPVIAEGGHLPPEVIQRIVRASFGRFRLCFENALRNCPNLQGRVSVHFTIVSDGSVRNNWVADSDLPDRKVGACVAREFASLSFPQPVGGWVTVIYPVMFAPGS